MLPSLIITLRETLEAALVVGIVFGYIKRTKQMQYSRVVYLGIATAVVASVIAAFSFERFAGGFIGRKEEIFEGVIMLVGALLLTTMIFWMMKRARTIKDRLEHEVAQEVTRHHIYGLFSLVFVSVLREGVETVIFLKAASIITGDQNLVGALFGIFIAVILGYAMFKGSMKINLKKFFLTTSLLLILFAAGLVAQGVHELQEARLLPVIVEQVWDINPQINADGSYPPLHDKGFIGSTLKGLFGYNGDPSLLEAVSYLLYFLLVFFLWNQIKKIIKTVPENLHQLQETS